MCPLAGLPYEERAVGRSCVENLTPGVPLRLCCAEDLLVLKAFASRPQDWIDVEGIVIRQQSTLDRGLIRSELGELCRLKEEPEILDRIEEIFKKYPLD